MKKEWYGMGNASDSDKICDPDILQPLVKFY